MAALVATDCEYRNPSPPGPPGPAEGSPIRKFVVVTTVHAAGYAEYGRTMVETFDRHWPADVPLWFYTEGFTPDAASSRVQAIDLATAAPELVAFKARHGNSDLARGRTRRFRPQLHRKRKFPWIKIKGRNWGQGYRWDAVRFAHKSFAMFDAARRCGADVLIWIDADTRFFADVSRERLESFVPEDRFVGYLARPRDTHTESGFLAFNLHHPATAPLLADFEAMYTRDLVFREYEFSDAHLFDVVRRRQEARGQRSHDIAEGVGLRASHVLVNCQLGEFMDHMKGDRKQDGVSRKGDLLVARKEAYWREVDGGGKPPA